MRLPRMGFGELSSYNMLPSDSLEDACDLEQKRSSMTKRRGTRNWLRFVMLTALALVGFIALTSIMQWGSVSQHASYSIPAGELVVLPHELPGIYPSPSSTTNATMGFGKIYVLNLVTRPDKRDEMLLMAKATGLELEFHHPTPVKEMEEKGLPPHGDWPFEVAAAGVTRGHMELYEKILQGPYETVLILEDDVDWDTNWAVALSRLSHAMATLLTSEKKDGLIRTPTEADPWSFESWDALYLGSCWEEKYAPGKVPADLDLDHIPVVTYLDPTVPSKEAWRPTSIDAFARFNYSTPGKETPLDERRRAIVRSAGPVCAESYAMTKRGAAKMLWYISRWLNLIDWSISDATRQGLLKTYSVIPSVVSQFRLNNISTSDKSAVEDGKTFAEKLAKARPWDLTNGVAPDQGPNSTRKNLKQLMWAMTKLS